MGGGFSDFFVKKSVAPKEGGNVLVVNARIS